MATGPTDSGEIRQVLSYDPNTRTLIMSTGFSSATDSAFSFELWEADRSPIMAEDYMDQAIANVTRKGAVPDSDSSIHLGANILNFPLPDNMIGVQKVENRDRFKQRVVRNLDNVMANPQTNVTVAADSEDRREGNASNKITVAAGFTTGNLINDTFIAIDLRGYTHLEGWIKSSIATDSSALNITLNTTTESLSVQALNADEWTWLSLPLANPESDSGITIFGLDSDSDFGAAVIWMDGFGALRDGTQDWAKVHRDLWSVEKDSRRIEIDAGHGIGYDAGLLRLSGLRVPALLTNDTDICEVDSQYVINWAVAQMLRASGNLRGDRRDAALIEAERRELLAQQSLARLATPRPVPVWSSD